MLGHARFLSKDIIGYIEENYKNYDGIFRIETPIRSLIMITKPEYVDYVLRENNKNYTKSFAYNTLKLLLGNGLLTSEGDFWRRQRRLIQPSFHKQKIEGYFLQMVDATNAFLQELKKEQNDLINITREMNSLTLDIVARALFGKHLEKETEIVRENLSVANEFAINRIKKILKPPTWLPTSENRNNNAALKALNEVVMHMIDERRKNPAAYDDLLSLLITARDEETGEEMDNQQLRDEVMTIFLAGHETSAIALNWLWFLVSTHPSVEKKLVQEIQEVASEREITLGDLLKLKYTTNVISETLRLYPPAYLVGRSAIAADKIGGYDILPESNVILCTYIVQRDESIWGSDAAQFIPERFDRQEVKKLHHFAYFPFGGGPRLCIGQNFAMMEMQVIVAKLIREFHFEPEKTFKPETSHLITLRSKHDLQVRVKERTFRNEKIPSGF